jgi:hypothetical protein
MVVRSALDASLRETSDWFFDSGFHPLLCVPKIFTAGIADRLRVHKCKMAGSSNGF